LTNKVASRTSERLSRSQAAARARFTGSSAEHLWRRLSAIDFVNRGLLLASILLLCFVPFLIVFQALIGRSAATSAIRRFGLSHQAAADVSTVFTSPNATSGAITGFSYVLFVLGGLAAASAIQELYENAFEVQGRGIKDVPRRLVWLGVLMGASTFSGWASPGLRALGGPVLLALLAMLALTGFWWFTLWWMLGGRRNWRELLPAALATAVCWLGMTIVFRLTMSATITSNYDKYGSIGVIFAIMSYLVAIGVVILIGAVFGVVWRERHPPEGSTGPAGP
jgi:membrane protein